MDSFFKRFGQVLKKKKSEYASQFRDLHWIMAYETSILRKLYTFKQSMSPTCTPPPQKIETIVVWKTTWGQNDWQPYSGSNKLEPF